MRTPHGLPVGKPKIVADVVELEELGGDASPIPCVDATFELRGTTWRRQGQGFHPSEQNLSRSKSTSPEKQLTFLFKSKDLFFQSTFTELTKLVR